MRRWVAQPVGLLSAYHGMGGLCNTELCVWEAPSPWKVTPAIASSPARTVPLVCTTEGTAGRCPRARRSAGNTSCAYVLSSPCVGWLATCDASRSNRAALGCTQWRVGATARRAPRWRSSVVGGELPLVKHPYIHTYIHAYMHACMHTYTHTYVHACIHTHIHTYIRTYVRTYTFRRRGVEKKTCVPNTGPQGAPKICLCH